MNAGMIKMCASAVVLGIIFTVPAAAQTPQTDKPSNAPRLSPNVTEEMLTPDFWIQNLNGDADEVILTPAQIVELNGKNRTKPYRFIDINGKEYSLLGKNTYLTDDPLAMVSIPGDSVRALIERWNAALERGSYYDFRHKEYDVYAKRALIEKTRINEIPTTIIPRYGILVAPSHNMKFPTSNEAWTEPEGWITNFSISSLDAASPVAVLHESLDGHFLFVRSEIHFGWVPAVHVAVGSAIDIGKFVNAKKFIVATDGKVGVYADTTHGAFLMDIYMGARMPLVKKASDGWHVLAPFRMPDGAFKAVPCLIRPDAGVSDGFQPFTRRNVIKTFFAKLNDPWSGGDYYEGRHCCGTMRGVLRTFGISVLNSTTFQLHASDHVYSYPEKTSNEVKYQYLAKCEPAVTLLGSPAHVILYLGEANGRQYVIHSTGYDYKAEDGTTLLLRRVNVNDTELEGGSQVDTWTYMCELKP